jgi:hypothetical protein
MAETLGTLCDKLTVVKLKQWHCDEEPKIKSLSLQERQLIEEIDDFLSSSLRGEIPMDKIIFAANKIYKKEGNLIGEVEGALGSVMSQLAYINCNIWHEQEKVYEFDKVIDKDKDIVIKKLALLNLERNKCIEAIDKNLFDILKTKK